MLAQPPAGGDSRPRFPAEWEPHRATWMAWPHHRDWGGELAGARQATAALIRAIRGSGNVDGEHIELLVDPRLDRDAVQRELSPIQPRVAGDHRDHCVTCHAVAYGDVWLRDIAPLFVVRGDALSASCFSFNGWGGKYVYEGDTEVADTVARLARCPARRFDFVLEGGAIECDGRGTVITTRQCLLAGDRNPGLSETDYERRLAESLGARTVVWLDRGLANDHTDGHVDNLARFVGPSRVICMEPAGPNDPNRETLLEIIASLRGARDASGEPFELLTVPSPGRVTTVDGVLMPASYLNFYISNRAVAMPVYGTHSDQEAVARISALFPTRQTVAIDSRALLSGGGSFHCITQQQPEVTTQ